MSKGGMSTHLASCRGPGKHLLLSVSSPRGPWWMYVAVSPAAKLADLDRVLRDAWLECCGHLSAFEIGGTTYQSQVFDDDRGPQARSMATAVSKVLAPGSKFAYEYDFGSTTRLTGRVARTIDGGTAWVSIVVRNEPIPWPCDACGDEADTICSLCGTLSCGCTDSCPECHEDLEDMGLPVVNSPRMGVCGYCG